MIENATQHQITQAQLKTFEEAIIEHDLSTCPDDLAPELFNAQRDALCSMRDELSAQLAEYQSRLAAVAAANQRRIARARPDSDIPIQHRNQT
jgi:hypothetical protein